MLAGAVYFGVFNLAGTDGGDDLSGIGHIRAGGILGRKAMANDGIASLADVTNIQSGWNALVRAHNASRRKQGGYRHGLKQLRGALWLWWTIDTMLGGNKGV